MREPGSPIAFALIALFATNLLSPPVAAQEATGDILELYRLRQMASIALVHSAIRMEAHPPRLIPYDAIGVVSGSVPELTRVAHPAFQIHRLRAVPKFAAGWFEEKFKDIEWSFDGGNTLAAVDTTFTRELRARLEHAFGAPTRTLADNGAIHRLDLDEYVQFEYWFLVDEQWPVILMDVNGPFERGIVVSGDARQRSLLIPLRDAILRPIMENSEKAPYSDYFFEPELGEWFVTGYDGESFFMRSIDARGVSPGRPAVPARSG
jgi:hypothetical protein